MIYGYYSLHISGTYGEPSYDATTYFWTSKTNNWTNVFPHSYTVHIYGNEQGRTMVMNNSGLVVCAEVIEDLSIYWDLHCKVAISTDWGATFEIKTIEIYSESDCYCNVCLDSQDNIWVGVLETNYPPDWVHMKINVYKSTDQGQTFDLVGSQLMTDVHTDWADDWDMCLDEHDGQVDVYFLFLEYYNTNNNGPMVIKFTNGTTYSSDYWGGYDADCMDYDRFKVTNGNVIIGHKTWDSNHPPYGRVESEMLQNEWNVLHNDHFAEHYGFYPLSSMSRYNSNIVYTISMCIDTTCLYDGYPWLYLSKDSGDTWTTYKGPAIDTSLINYYFHSVNLYGNKIAVAYQLYMEVGNPVTVIYVGDIPTGGSISWSLIATIPYDSRYGDYVPPTLAMAEMLGGLFFRNTGENKGYWTQNPDSPSKQTAFNHTTGYLEAGGSPSPKLDLDTDKYRKEV